MVPEVEDIIKEMQSQSVQNSIMAASVMSKSFDDKLLDHSTSDAFDSLGLTER